MKYRVMVKAVEGRVIHSEWESYREAINQSDMVRGDVYTAMGHSDRYCFDWSKKHQGYEGTYDEWRSMDDEERNEFEIEG